MAFPNIYDFKESLTDGGARPSLFQMELTWPISIPAPGDLILNAERAFHFHCRISEIPGTQHNPITVKYAGREIKYAGQRVFNNLTVTVLNDEAFTVRRALEAWFEGMNSRVSNLSLFPLASPTAVGYAGQGTVYQYAKNGNITRSYSFVDMFPVTLAPVALDWTNDGAIEDYTCEFAYQYWTPNGEDRALDPEDIGSRAGRLGF